MTILSGSSTPISAVSPPVRRAVVLKADLVASLTTAYKASYARSVSRYLPRNYELVAASDGSLTIVGHDVAGWTLEYVIDRLASGLYFAEEVTA